jgi:hypothetical protein
MTDLDARCSSRWLLEAVEAPAGLPSRFAGGIPRSVDPLLPPWLTKRRRRFAWLRH